MTTLSLSANIADSTSVKKVKILNFASDSSYLDLTDALYFSNKESENYTYDAISSIDTWHPIKNLPRDVIQKGILVKLAIENFEGQNLPCVLYLHDLQSVNIYTKNKYPGIQTTTAGTLLMPKDRQIQRGLVIPGYGYSTQIELELAEGINEIFLDISYTVRKPFQPDVRLYRFQEWNEVLIKDFEKNILVHLLLFGAMWIMAIYHLLIYFQRKDSAFLWYAIYSFVISVNLLIESGIFSIYITPDFPLVNNLYRYLQLHAFCAYLVYWMFLRDFVNLKTLLPAHDKFLVRYLIGFTIVSIVTTAIYINGLYGEYVEMTFISFLLPFTGLIFGVVYYFFITKAKNKFVNLFLIGSLLLLLGVFANTIITASIHFGWIEQFPFPNFLFTEIAVLIELLFFALILGYRSSLMDMERKRVIELDEIKSKFFANISHELRTPITVISGMAEQLKGNFQTRELIQRNSKNLLRLVNQLLDLSKLDSGQLKSNIMTADIVKFLNYVTESFYAVAAEKNIRLNFYSEQKEIIMDFDEMKIQQIISNLLSNAIKFTGKMGKIVLHVKATETDGIPHLQIKVKDTGIGIVAQNLPFVFDRFYQVDSSIARRENGTGIGLALTRELVEHAGGTISVTSEIDCGTEFSILLPISETQKVSVFNFETNEFENNIVPFAKGTASEVTKNGLTTSESHLDKLLLIDDNPDIIIYLKQLLKGKYDITVARDGIEGVNIALESVPDIILSDVMMPGKDGYELCNTLKSDRRTSHIPIILLTAKAGQEDKIIGLKGGADAYLTKPFDKKELFVRLEKLIESRLSLQRYYLSSTFENMPKSSRKPRPIGTANETEITTHIDIESEFLIKIKELVISRLDDPQLGVKDLCKKAGLSSMQVNRKLKALTGKTANQFIRSLRLEKANKLLKNSSLNISEIAYDVGFSDPNYFSRVFSDTYGISPTEFRK